MKESILLEKSYGFALQMIKLFRFLSEKKKDFILSKQLLRSRTSIGANIEEAHQAQSKPDFIHKLCIANKEAFETNYRLRLMRDSEILTAKQAESLLADCKELQKLLTASIKTSKNN